MEDEYIFGHATDLDELGSNVEIFLPTHRNGYRKKWAANTKSVLNLAPW